MPTITHTIHIDAAPEQVWALLGERFGDLDVWAKVPNCRLDEEGPVGVGTARLIELPIGTLRETIVRFEAPHHLAYEVTGLPLMWGVRSDWVLEADDTGTTVRFTNTSEEGPWPIGPLLSRLTRGPLSRQLSGLLRSLQRAVESGQ